jgi:hypothetical protein
MQKPLHFYDGGFIFWADLRSLLRHAAFGSYAGANYFQSGRPVARRFFGNVVRGLPN